VTGEQAKEGKNATADKGGNFGGSQIVSGLQDTQGSWVRKVGSKEIMGFA